MTSKPGSAHVSGQRRAPVRRVPSTREQPARGPGGVRRRGGVSSLQALAWQFAIVRPRRFRDAESAEEVTSQGSASHNVGPSSVAAARASPGYLRGKGRRGHAVILGYQAALSARSASKPRSKVAAARTRLRGRHRSPRASECRGSGSEARHDRCREPG